MKCYLFLLSLRVLAYDLEIAATDFLQQKLQLVPASCGLGPGIHLVKLPKLQRQFLFMMPRGPVESQFGLPVFMFFHGAFQTPYFSIKTLGLPDMLERYGWAAVLPFGQYEVDDSNMQGPLQCCSDLCDSEECCFEARQGQTADLSGPGPCAFWPGKIDQNLQMIDAIFDWMTSLRCIDSSKVFAAGFSLGATLVQDLACFRSWQFQGFAPDASPGDRVAQRNATKDCSNATATTYISFCGTMDVDFCYVNLMDRAAISANHSLCTSQEVRRKSATVNCTVWTGCQDGHIVEACMVDGMDHDISGRMEPDSTSFLHPGSDLDFTKYIFEKFSLRVAPDQLRFHGHPTQEEEDWKQSSWPPQKMFDNMYLREALAVQGMETLPNRKLSIASVFEFDGQ